MWWWKPRGPAKVETYTVITDRKAKRFGLIVGRAWDGARFLAHTPDDDATLNRMMHEEMLGREGEVSQDGPSNLRSGSPDGALVCCAPRPRRQQGEVVDPGLDDLGRAQAQEVAEKLAPLGPLTIVSSPLARACQTAAQPLAKLWQREPIIEDAVAEIPSPGLELDERARWLRKFMAGSWRGATPALAQWRENVISALTALNKDTVIFSHYLALNVAMGAAIEDDRVTVYSPQNCSVTIFETQNGKLTLVERGKEVLLTKVN